MMNIPANDAFDLSNIFIGRQQQLEIFALYLQNWQGIMAKSPVDPNPSPIITSPSPNNKMQGFVTLLYGRGGFGKSSLLKRYRERAIAATPRLIVSEIVDWEFAIQEKRSVFNPPAGQNIDAHEYFKVLTDRLASALQKKQADFKEYQAAVRDVEKAQKSFQTIVDSMQKDDRYSWLRGIALDAISTVVRTYIPGSSAVLANPKVQTATSELAKLTQAQIVEIHTKVRDKLGSKVGDYLDPALRLGLAIGYDLNVFARNFPLCIFFDTYEEIDEGDDLLRSVMHAAGQRVGWVIAGRDNLWAGLAQRKRSTATEYGYKDLVPSDRGLSINFNADDIGAFALSDITDYFQLIRKQIPTLPTITEEETQKILDVTRGIPLAIKIAAGLYIETAEVDIFTGKTDGKREIVDVMVRRYLQHTHSSESEKAKLYALALLRRADQPPAVAIALGLTPEQAKSEYATALSNLHRRYSFIFTEKEQPSLHQEVRYFLRLWLLEHSQEPHIIAINERLREHHEQMLKQLEERRHYSTLNDRLQDTAWANTYLDLVEQQFWLNPSDGIRSILPFMLAAAIYQRTINQDAATIGAFFQETNGERPYIQWWQWVYESLAFTDSHYPSDKEMHALQNLTKLAEQRCPGFVSPLPDYKQELEAALWWRMGEAYRDKEDDQSITWYEKALARLPDEPELKSALAQAYFARGEKLYEEKLYEECIKTLKKGFELEASYSRAYHFRGLAYNDLKEFEQAIADYDQAIALDPDDATAYYNRGVAYYTLKEFERAIASYDQAIALNPDDAIAYYNRGLAYDTLKEFERAIANYDQAIALNPEYTDAYNNRGLAYNDLKEFEQAIADYDRAIALNPEYADAYNNRGLAYNDLKEFERAIANYDQAIALNPEYTDAYYNRGLAYNDLKEFEQAIASYDQAIALNPEYTDAYYNRGLAYNDLKEFEQAIANYDQAIALNPEYADAYNNRGVAYNDLKEFERAIANYDQAIALNPEYTDAYYNRGLAYNDLKEFEQAIASYDQAIALGPDDATAYYNRGLAYTYLKKYALAINDYQYVLQHSPPEYIRYFAQGLLSGLEGRLKEALTELEKVIELEPEDYDAYFWKGMFSAYFYKGRPHIAYAAIQKALELGMPPGLLTPLYWLQEDRPDFFNSHAKPLLEQYEV